MQFEEIPELPIPENIQLAKCFRGPLDGQEQYFPKFAGGWACPITDADGNCLWYPYYRFRNTNAWYWDGRALTTEEIQKEEQ